jgi:hypothetical protein
LKTLLDEDAHDLLTMVDLLNPDLGKATDG